MVISCVGGGHLNEEKNNKVTSETSENVRVPAKSESTLNVADTVALKIMRNNILTSIKNQDYSTLSNYFHPDTGVRFSPFAFVNTDKDVQLNASEFLDAIKTNKKFTWGFAAGSGSPIELTIPEYFKQYVYNADFINAAKTSVNKMIATGNSQNNLLEVYPEALYTENYDPGKSEMAWTSLRLVFDQKGEKLYLRGIIHDKWTP